MLDNQDSRSTIAMPLHRLPAFLHSSETPSAFLRISAVHFRDLLPGLGRICAHKVTTSGGVKCARTENFYLYVPERLTRDFCLPGVVCAHKTDPWAIYRGTAFFGQRPFPVNRQSAIENQQPKVREAKSRIENLSKQVLVV